jgi:hypothetical protein
MISIALTKHLIMAINTAALTKHLTMATDTAA